MELNACLNAVDEHVSGMAEYPISAHETEHFQMMVENFVDWLHDMALLDEDGALDDEAMKQVCEDMMCGGEKEEEDEDEL